MKTICKLSFLFFALAWTACKKDKTPEEPNPAEEWGITIVDGMIQSPEWLVHQIDSIGDLYLPTPSGDKNYPFIYGTEYNGEKYIFVWDPLNASYVRGKRYFTLSGNLIDYSSSLWTELNDSQGDNMILLWTSFPVGFCFYKSRPRDIFSFYAQWHTGSRYVH